MNKSAALLAILLAASCGARASTPTENIGMQVVPAPGPVVIDGRVGDWDLSGSVLASNDVETQRDDFAVWLSTMYDAKNLYILARFKDKTPLNNPGQTISDYGFNGDSLQVRTITHPNTPDQLIGNITAWQGREGRDVIDLEYEGGRSRLRDARAEGAQQAFRVDPDRQGYTQELAIPWTLLTKDGQPLHAGGTFRLTFEPNFTTPGGGRLSVKDVFQPLPSIDRVFAFMNKPEWGTATLAPAGHLALRPVRLSGGREFPTHLEAGVPVVDWTGLFQAPKLPGFIPITFTMPADGMISLNIKNTAGQVVCQLLRGEFYQKGRHTVNWDGLTTPNAHQPGQPVPAGSYTWSALTNTGIGLKLRGWADNSGIAPWDSDPTTGWGGDHGNPVAVAADDSGVYLGWSEAEAGKALVATDFNGNVRWRANHAGMPEANFVSSADVFQISSNRAKTEAGVSPFTFVDIPTVFAIGGKPVLYRLDAKTGLYATWDGTASTDLNLADYFEGANKPTHADGLLAVSEGPLFVSFAEQDTVLMLEPTGHFLKRLSVHSPGALAIGRDTRSGGTGRAPTEIYVVSGHSQVLVVNPWTGETHVLIDHLPNATSIAIDRDTVVRGPNLYVGLGEPENQVRVYEPYWPAGPPSDVIHFRLLRTIGRKGGRPLTGPWQPDGMRFIAGMAVDPTGKLWVTENDDTPKRVSVWDTKTGAFVKEFFGSSHYGAQGGCIDPADPDIMVGSGCEWRLDPKTGRARLLSVITHDGIATSGFALGPNRRVYLVVAHSQRADKPVDIYERLGDANYVPRARFSYEGKGAAAVTHYWADANGDGLEQPDEVTTVPGTIQVGGWYLWMAPDMTFYHGYDQYKVSGWTACGAPRYDLAHPVRMPHGQEVGFDGFIGLGSPDDRMVLYDQGPYMVDRSWFNCYDIGSGKKLWSYPNNYLGVHGSHNATPPEPGMIRGTYDIVASVKLPAPIGNAWIIPTNVGEWHMLNEDGFYLTRLFQPDPFKFQFPNPAVPGADMTNAPPGSGGEDFGGSATLGTDGKLYLEAGKTGYWNLEVTGLETVRALPGGTLQVREDDVKKAAALEESENQETQGVRLLTVTRMTPQFTGNLNADFPGAQVITYQKGEETKTRSTAAYDDTTLYLAWEVQDPTPWVNGATEPQNLYIGGDTVDFQLGTNPAASKTRSEAGPGDLRLSIGPFQGQNLAMLYRKVSAVKKPGVFHSGIVANYPMDYVAPVVDAKIMVKQRPGGYTVEAAIPLAELDLAPQPGQTLSGDFGVTFGEPGGQRTRLRSYWSSQHTGIVDDVVYELMMEPRNWGQLQFSP